jgi:hypothetical protein
MMKGKVLSVRISEKDLASCVELCNSVNLKPIGMGGYLTKTLGILLENLRQSHKVMNMSESQAREVLKQTFGDREVGYSCELPDSFVDFVPPPSGQVVSISHLSGIVTAKDEQFYKNAFEQLAKEEPKIPHFSRQTEQYIQQSNQEIHEQVVSLCSDQPDNWPAKEDELKFDQDLEEEIRLSAMLEGENLIDKLLVTEHRADDAETKLMNPDLAGPVLTKKEDETE